MGDIVPNQQQQQPKPRYQPQQGPMQAQPQQARTADPGQRANALMGPMGAPDGTTQGGIGAQVGQVYGAQEGMHRAATGGMDPSIQQDIMQALFGGQGPASTGTRATGMATQPGEGAPWRQ